MRFYEFAPQPNRPVLKISQQAQQRAANTATAQPADTPTPFPRNTTPTTTAAAAAVLCNLPMRLCRVVSVVPCLS